jgi:hypothetical protein
LNDISRWLFGNLIWPSLTVELVDKRLPYLMRSDVTGEAFTSVTLAARQGLAEGMTTIVGLLELSISLDQVGVQT